MTGTLSVSVPEQPTETAPARRVWTVVLAGLGALLCSLDVVVVATALPALRADFGASLSDLEWTINAYNLVFACLTLTGAALGDRFGRRRMYLVGLAVFTLGSAASALAGGPGPLIGARVVQGAGAAVLLPLTLTLISDAFPAEKRGVAIGVWGGVTGLGVAAGPVLGGAVTEGLSWQWIFWLNVPIGLAMLPLAATKLRESYGTRPQLDLVGLVLAAVGLTGLAWAPVRAPQAGWGVPRCSPRWPWGSCSRWPSSPGSAGAPGTRCCRSGTSETAVSPPPTRSPSFSSGPCWAPSS